MLETITFSYVARLVDQASQVIPNSVATQDMDDYTYYLMARGLYFLINKIML